MRAWLVTLTRTGELLPPDGASNVSTNLENCWPTASAIAFARRGDRSSTVTSMRTVPVGTDARISSWSWRMPYSRRSCSITALATAGLDTIGAYESTRCWEKSPP
jgi:hypothetical protein